MIYNIEITETMQKAVEVEAHSYIEAVKKVKEQYDMCEIILDSNDLMDVEIK